MLSISPLFVIAFIICFFCSFSCCQYSPSNPFNVLTTSSMMYSYPLAAAYENFTGFPPGTVKLLSVSSAQMGFALANTTAYALPRIDAVLGLDNMVELLTAEHFVQFTLDNKADIYAPIAGLGDYTHLKPFDFGLISLIYNPTVKPKIHELRANFTLEMLAANNLFPETILVNPLKSTAGLGFFMWVYSLYGDRANNVNAKFPQQSGGKDYLDWWKNAFQSGVTMSDSWSRAHKRFLDAKDPIKLISSYASSDAYGFCTGDKTGALSMVSHAPDGSAYAWAQVEGMAVVNTTLNITESEKFMNFLFTPAIQQEIFLHNFMYPANEKKTRSAPSCWEQADPIDPWQTGLTLLNRDLNGVDLETILPKALAAWDKLYNEVYVPMHTPKTNGAVGGQTMNMMMIVTFISTIIAAFKML